MTKRSKLIPLVLTGLLLVLATPLQAFAYVGPGAGLGAIVSLVAVAAGVLIALVGLVVFPLRLLLKRRNRKP